VPRAWVALAAWLVVVSVAVAGTTLGPEQPEPGLPAASEVALKGSDAEIWREFASWVDALPRRPPGRSLDLRRLYVDDLVARGIPRPEAEGRLDRIDLLRGASEERERVYWNGKAKLGDGPSAPLPLLQEAVRGVEPGRALDVAMGSGRNSVYLAGLGWDVTGYDLAPDALRAARDAARRAGVTIRTVEATHETFDFGKTAWDLIVVSYAYIDTLDPSWPPRLWHSLRPGGLVVFQGTAAEGPSSSEVSRLWEPFRLLRFEDLNRGEEWFEGQPVRTIKVVARKVSSPGGRTPP
jgi:SAM-dependent methyltransferase